MSIIEKLNINTGQYVVRKRTDESFDSPFVEYSINAHFPWGEQNLACGIENPNTARLFAAAPEILKALIWALSVNGYDYQQVWQKHIAIIEKATGKSWAEIKELL